MRYRNSQDLGVFIGARFIAQTFTEGGPVIRGIFIPVDINGITVNQDTREEGKRNASGFRAFINTQQRYCNNRYIDAIKQKLQREGEPITAYNVPSHQICYTLPEEKRTKIRAALAKNIIKQHPEWAQQKDEDKDSDLHKAISRMMPFQMGDSYLIEEKTSQGAYQPTSTAPVAQQVSGYTPPTNDPFNSEQYNNGSDDDLPF